MGNGKRIKLSALFEANNCTDLLAGNKEAYVKICGVTTLEDAKALICAGVDAIGILLAKFKSHAYPLTDRVTVKEAKNIIDCVKDEIASVLLIHEWDLSAIVSLISTLNPFAIQVQTDLPLDTLLKIKERFPHIYLIKTFRISRALSDEMITQSILHYIHAQAVDAILLDSERPGSGEANNWDRVKNIWSSVDTVPVIVAGGINSANISDVIRQLCPSCVDIMSAVRRDKHRIDIEKARELIAIAKSGPLKR